MKIQFLGTGSAINSDRLGSSILVNDSILVDAPGGINQRLLNLGIQMSQVSAILITHAHGDHIFGLPFVLLEYMLEPRSTPLMIYAPGDIQNKVIQLMKLAFPEADPIKLLASARPQYVSISDGFEAKINDLQVAVISVPHGPVETYGFEIADHARRVLYCPDIENIAVIQSYLERANAAILDATTLQAPVAAHTSLRQLARLALSSPTLQVYATHRGRYDSNLDEMPRNLHIPLDGEIAHI